ncbi:MAG: sigma-70 family RNA polymerase sigma factor [Acidobacteria bacterium]|nr:sigma-70 family RNA polymerase sigma factor [Acidobacteriota bacterium]
MQEAAAGDGPEQEAQWIRRMAEGDREAFERLFHAYQRRVFAYIWRLLNDTPLAEELTNDVLVEVWKGAKRFRGQGKPSSWIFGIAHHKVLDQMRRRRPRTAGIEEMFRMADPAEGPEAQALRQDERAALQAALARLSPEHREVLELTFYQGCSVEEIARITDCPPNTVKTRMFYARKKLREMLEKP